RALRAGEQHAADGVVGIKGRDRLRQLGVERGVERIERLRPVEPDDTDASARFDDDGFVAHAFALDRLRRGPAPNCRSGYSPPPPACAKIVTQGGKEP